MSNDVFLRMNKGFKFDQSRDHLWFWRSKQEPSILKARAPKDKPLDDPGQMSKRWVDRTWHYFCSDVLKLRNPVTERYDFCGTHKSPSSNARIIDSQVQRIKEQDQVLSSELGY